ncbi:MAG: hypothetical protein K2G36_09490, partial [Ruminococcus sp.]|nr:hypothetical protein [Ruminococcus sp.]
ENISDDDSREDANQDTTLNQDDYEENISDDNDSKDDTNQDTTLNQDDFEENISDDDDFEDDTNQDTTLNQDDSEENISDDDEDSRDDTNQDNVLNQDDSEENISDDDSIEDANQDNYDAFVLEDEIPEEPTESEPPKTELLESGLPQTDPMKNVPDSTPVGSALEAILESLRKHMEQLPKKEPDTLPENATIADLLANMNKRIQRKKEIEERNKQWQQEQQVLIDRWEEEKRIAREKWEIEKKELEKKQQEKMEEERKLMEKVRQVQWERSLKELEKLEQEKKEYWENWERENLGKENTEQAKSESPKTEPPKTESPKTEPPKKQEPQNKPSSPNPLLTNNNSSNPLSSLNITLPSTTASFSSVGLNNNPIITPPKREKKKKKKEKKKKKLWNVENLVFNPRQLMLIAKRKAERGEIPPDEPVFTTEDQIIEYLTGSIFSQREMIEEMREEKRRTRPNENTAEVIKSLIPEEVTDEDLKPLVLDEEILTEEEKREREMLAAKKARGFNPHKTPEDALDASDPDLDICAVFDVYKKDVKGFLDLSSESLEFKPLVDKLDNYIRTTYMTFPKFKFLIEKLNMISDHGEYYHNYLTFADVEFFESFKKNFNEICTSFPTINWDISSLKEPIPSPVNKILKRMTEDDIKKGLYKLEHSSRLNGKNGKPQVSFDWIFTYKNFALVLNGAYDDGVNLSWDEYCEIIQKQYDASYKIPGNRIDENRECQYYLTFDWNNDECILYPEDIIPE